MKKVLILVAAAVMAASASADVVDYVNPLVGTAEKGEGGAAPFVGTPFAMTKVIPQTRENKMGTMAYLYDDKTMCGVLASHQPTVWMGDYGYVSLMPQVTSKVKPLPEDRKLPYSHANEKATPYYYSVALDASQNQQIKVEFSAASRAALVKMTFPHLVGNRRVIVQGINLNPKLGDWANDYGPRMKGEHGWVKVLPERGEIIGYNPDRQAEQIGPKLPNFKGYFVIKFNKPFKKFGTWNRNKVHEGNYELYGTRMGAYVEFDGDEVMAQVGTSFISIEQARSNMAKELPGWDLAKLSKTTRKAWKEKMEKFDLKGVTDEQKSIFYTALYHCYQYPREFSEYGRYYSAFDDEVHVGEAYNDFSLWDTFRAFHPLMTIVEPKLTSDWVTSLLQMYKEGGWMPMWPNPTYTNIMIGTHADAVIADAYMKGIRNYDVNLAYEAMRKDAMVAPEADTERRYGDRDRWTAYEGRAGMTYYKSLGFIPDDKTAEALSRTLEYAYDDWCVAQMAKALGHDADYKHLMGWSQNYRNVYNKEEGFMLPRRANGEWIILDDHNRTALTEGSKWTYLFCVLQDVPGMIEMMGGNEKFAHMLDRNFAEKHYKHDNEPGHHYIYLYDYCGQPWKAQELVREHTRVNYHNAPDGLNGNDDCGQMSAWYIFSVMGFYPVTPGSNTYAIGAPQFPQVSVKVCDPNLREHKLTIEAKNLSEANKYVKRVMVDGVVLNEPFISHAQLMGAKKIVFEMGSERP